jgi:hypothetical protein
MKQASIPFAFSHQLDLSKAISGEITIVIPGNSSWVIENKLIYI